MLTELSGILVIVAVLGFLLRRLKLPLMIGYLLTGLVAGPFLLDTLHSSQTLSLFSSLGITTLLFSIGLHLSFRAIKNLGKQVLILGFFQVLLTVIASLGLLYLLHFSFWSAVFTGLALSFSSTIIILKLLSDKNEIHQLHGKMSVGLLLIQDVIVSLVLIGLASWASSGQTAISSLVLGLVLKAGLIALVMVFIGKWLLNPLLKKVADDQELLFVFSLAWGVGWALIFDKIGFSMEIGALVAGVVLASTIYAEEIAARLRPLRDFFILLFFVELGAGISLGSFMPLLLPILALTLVVLLWKPVIVMLVMKLLKFQPQTSFKTGVSMAQISEFSLIMMAMGLEVGLVTQDEYSILGFVGIITMTLSTLAISRLDGFYDWVKPVFDVVKSKIKPVAKSQSPKVPDVLVFGYHRVGRQFIDGLERQKYRVSVVDFNPQVVEQLTQDKVPHHFGDAGDIQFLSELPLEKVKLVVSTIPSLENNLLLVTELKSRAGKASIIVFSHDDAQAESLYERGADLVILPHKLAAQRVVYWLARYGIDPQALGRKRE
ncbi:MAG: cation:proton antiporter [Patescibacteria group bacterium]